MSVTKPRFLITGTMGCIGAWVLRNLLDDGIDVVATDLDTTVTRPALLLNESEIASITWEQLDVTDDSAVNDIFAKHKPTHLIHLAGLQIPFCKASPTLGAAVNVVGTVNLFEAARHNGVQGLSYASSVGVFGAPDLYPEGMIEDTTPGIPNNLYGVYKIANENTATVYWRDWQVGSVGLRPYVVYGVARDQGMTADLAKAILAVAAGERFHIRFDGPIAMQHASDVAKIFIKSALSEHQGADVYNLRNDVIEVSEFVAVLKGLYPQAQITFEENNPLPFPANYNDANLKELLGTVPHVSLEQAIQSDVAQFTSLLESNQLTTDCLTA